MKTIASFTPLLSVILSVVLVIFLTFPAAAHGSHKKKKAETEQTYEVSDIQVELSDFPTLHPLVIHFPIVLLVLAFFSQAFSFIVFKKELGWVTIALLLGGFISAWLAGSVFHPHTDELNNKLQLILEEHEKYADYTFWLSLSALIIKLVSQFILKLKLWSELAVILILTGTVWTISKAGHYGAQLTHIEGVGVKGKFIESEDNDNTHH